MDNDGKKSPAQRYITKKCWECFTHLPLNAKVCTSCGKRVGEIDKQGKAKRPVDIMGYLMAAVSIAIFLAVIWYGFIR